MPTYRITAPNGLTYEIEGPPGASDAEVAQAVLAQNPEAGSPPKQAPFSLKDTGLSLAQGVTGAVKGVASAFGADNSVAETLGGYQKALGEAMTPERQAEQQRRALLEKQAAKSGSLTDEIGAFLGGVKEAPVQAVAQGVGSAVPAIAAGLATVVMGAPAAIAGAVTIGARLLFGAIQGAGEVKGDIMETVERELREKGVPAPEARAQAIAAQDYLGKNAANIMGGAGLGAVASGTGVENVLTRAATKKGASKAGESFLGRMVKEGGKEALPEGAQGGQGQYAQNVALDREGVETPAFQGVVGSAARDAATGALTGAAVSPMGRNAPKAPTGQPTDAEQRLKAAREQEELARADALAKKQEAKNIKDAQIRRFEGDQGVLFGRKETPNPMLPEKDLQGNVLQRAEPEPAEDKTPITRTEATEAGNQELPLDQAREEKDLIQERAALQFELESLKGERNAQAEENKAKLRLRIEELDQELIRIEDERGPQLGERGPRQGKLFDVEPAPTTPRQAQTPEPEETAAPEGQLDLGIDAQKDYADLVKERESLRAIPYGERSPELRAYLQKLNQDIKDRILFDLDAAQQKRAQELKAQEGLIREEELADQSAFAQPVEGKEAPVPEPAVRQPLTLQTYPSKLDADLRKLLGIGPTASLFKPEGGILGKDISDPAQAAQVKDTLESYLERPTLSPNIVERIGEFLKRPEFQGVQSGSGQPAAPQTVSSPAPQGVSEQATDTAGNQSGVGVSRKPARAKPVQSGTGTAAATEKSGEPDGRGLVSSEQPAGEGTDTGESKPVALREKKQPKTKPEAKKEEPKKEEPTTRKAGMTANEQKPINKAIEKLDDLKLDPDTTKAKAVNFAKKLHKDGLIDDASMNAVNDMAKDRDMGPEDIFSEVDLALQDTKDALDKGSRKSVQVTNGKPQQTLEQLTKSIEEGKGLLATMLRRLVKSGKVKLAEISPDGDATVGGLYDGSAVTLYAAGVRKGEAVAVALHEVGAHLGLKKLLGEQQYAELSQRIVQMASSKTASPERALAQRALARIPKQDVARGKDVVQDEAIAYFAEELAKAEMSGELPKTGPLRIAYNRIRAALQAAINRVFGTSFGTESLTPDQIGFLIKGAMGVEAFIDTKAGSLTPVQRNLSRSGGSAVDKFAPNEVDKLREVGYKSRDKLIEMPIDDFLAMANAADPESSYNKEKSTGTTKLLAEGKPFSSLPFLIVDRNGRVEGHEGRHRALALKDAGYESMPVILRSANIRWSEQSDPDGFDYVEQWPTKLQAQEKATNPNRTIPFPVAREQASQPYTSTNPDIRFSKSLQAVSDADVEAVNRMIMASPLPPDQGRSMVSQAYAGMEQARKDVGLTAWLRQKTVDKYASVLAKTSQYFSQGVRDSFGNLNPEVLLRQAEDNPKVIAAFLHKGGIRVNKDGLFEVVKADESMATVLQDIKKFGEANGMTPQAAKDFVSKVLEGHRLYALEKNGIKSTMTRQQLQQLEDVYQRTKAIQEIQADMNAIRERTIELMVATGRISQKQADFWNSNKDYVPFNRVFDENKEGVPFVVRGKGIAVLRNIPELVGSYSRPVENVIDAYAERLGYMIEESMRNQAAVKTLEVMRLAGYAESIPSKEAAKNRNLVVPRLYKDGQPVFYEVQNQYDFLAFQQAPEITGGFIKFLESVSRVLRLSITAMPPFAAKQVLDDAQRAMVYSGVERPLAVAVRTLYNFPKIFFGELTGRKSPAVRRMEEFGIVGDYDSNLIRPTKDLEYELGYVKRGYGESIIHFLEKITKASDLAARTAVFEETMRDTKGDELLAQTRARELINFSRKGSSARMRTLNRVVPFFNAYAQGMDVLYRSASGIDSSSAAERTAARKLFYSRMGVLFSMGLVYALAMSDDDSYKKSTEEERDNNWILPGDYKIPVPKEIGFLFKSIPERLVEYTRRYGTDEEQTVREALGTTVKAAYSAYTSPTAVPSFFRPVLEHMANYSFFLQRELVPGSMKERDAAYQFDSNTSEFAKAIGKAADTVSRQVLDKPSPLSPIVIDNYLRGLFGMAGATTLLATDALLNPTRPDRPLYQMPFASIIMKDPIGSRDKNEFYELRERAVKAKNTYNKLLETDPAAADAYAANNYALIDAATDVNAMLGELSSIRKEKELLAQGGDEVVGMSSQERRDMIDQLRREENLVVADIRKLKKLVRDAQE